MCLVAIEWRRLNGSGLVLLANREEFRDRPSAAPALRSEADGRQRWMGGLDLRAGGTWLGVNHRAVVVAVTNRRDRPAPPRARSRGLLCRGLLAHESAETAFDEALKALETEPYAGCNVLVADANRALVVEHAASGIRTHQLQPGLLVLTSGSPDDPADSRVLRVHREFARRRPASVADWIRTASRIAGLDDGPQESALCRSHGLHGTVSSTILAISEDVEASRYLFAAGPPNSVPYMDLSHQLRRLLRERAEPRHAAVAPSV